MDFQEQIELIQAAQTTKLGPQSQVHATLNVLWKLRERAFHMYLCVSVYSTYISQYHSNYTLIRHDLGMKHSKYVHILIS